MEICRLCYLKCLIKKTLCSHPVVAHTFNPSSWEAEAGKSQWVQGQPGLQRKFQDSQAYTQSNCIKKEEKKLFVIKRWTNSWQCPISSIEDDEKQGGACFKCGKAVHWAGDRNLGLQSGLSYPTTHCCLTGGSLKEEKRKLATKKHMKTLI